MEKLPKQIINDDDIVTIDNDLTFNPYNLNNIEMRINLLEACKINKVKNIIWVSSSTVYQPLNKPIKEKDIDLNIKPYKI